MPATMEEMSGWDWLGEVFGLPAGVRGRLARHWELVRVRREAGRLTAVEGEEAIRRHYAESLELLRLAEGWLASGAAVRYADVGTGGGWPGLVVALARPEWEVHVIEPLQKRARFLEAAAMELGCGNVTVHALRAEEAGRGWLRERCDLVTARAVAELRVLLEYAAPLAAVGGLVALPKGSRLEAELAEAGEAMAILGCELLGVEPMRPEVSASGRVALFRKGRACPEGFPRRPGVPERRPIGAR